MLAEGAWAPPASENWMLVHSDRTWLPGLLLQSATPATAAPGATSAAWATRPASTPRPFVGAAPRASRASAARRATSPPRSPPAAPAGQPTATPPAPCSRRGLCRWGAAATPAWPTASHARRRTAAPTAAARPSGLCGTEWRSSAVSAWQLGLSWQRAQLLLSPRSEGRVPMLPALGFLPHALHLVTLPGQGLCSQLSARPAARQPCCPETVLPLCTQSSQWPSRSDDRVC